MRAKDKQRQRRRRWQRSLVCLVLAVGGAGASAQSIYLPQQADQVFTMPHLKYLGVDVEMERDTYKQKFGGTATSSRIYFAPVMGIGWNYFLYHPDLLTFSMLVEPGYNWQQTRNGGAASSQDAWLLNGNFNSTLLRNKPYATTMNYNRSHEQHSYDFFNSATVDSTVWGVNTGYRAGPVPVLLSYSHAQRDSSGLNYNSTSDSDTFSLNAQNTRHVEDITVLNYQFSRFNSTSTSASDGGSNAPQSFTDASTLSTLSLTDTEIFRRSALNSSLNYDHVTGTGSSSDNVNGGLDYGWQHTPRLRSLYGYNFNVYSTGGTEAIYQFARAGVEHQLFESLRTSAEVHGAINHSGSQGSTLDQHIIGTTESVNYSKRLANWGHLSIGDTVNYDITQQGSTGNEQLIVNESHTVPPTGIFFLNQPRDLTLVSLTDSSGAITYVQGSDYDVITGTSPWQIRTYTVGPNHITAGQTVKATYYVQPNPNGSYGTFNNNFQIRLDFWNNHAGLFLRYNVHESQASSEDFVLESSTELQTGGDFNWHNLRLAATYTDRSSSFYSYQSVSTSESYTLLATAKNSASLNFNQQWSSYPGAGGTNHLGRVSFYSWTGRYEWHPVATFHWTCEAGYEQQHGGGTDQDFIVARTSIGWNIGKLDVRLGYEFQSQDYRTEIRQRNFAFIRIRRNF